MKKIVSLLLCLVLIVFGAACTRQQESPEDQIILYAIDSEPVTLDPQIANDAGARMLILNLFEGLVRLNEENDPVPGAAERWEISGDHMRYTFYLRKGIKWNDGTPVISADFLYGLKRALLPQTSSPTASMLFGIRNAEKINRGEISPDHLGVMIPDSQTLIIQLEYPDADFLQVLSTPAAMPCHQNFFEKTAGQYGREADKLLCNGAFAIRSNGWVHDDHIYLRKNREYVGLASPIPAGVNVQIGGSPENVCDAILSGTLDCAPVSASEAGKAKEAGLTLTGFGDTLWGISLNCEDILLKNRTLRLALLAALSYEEIVKDMPDGCMQTHTLIPDSAQVDNRFYRKTVGDISFSAGQDASALLKQAVKDLETDAALKFTILCPDDEASQTCVNTMIETWNRLTGSYFNKKPVPLSELKDRVARGEYEIALAPLTVEGTSPLDTLEAFSQNSRQNLPHFASEEFEGMLETLKRRQGDSYAGQIGKAEAFLVDQGVFYPLYTENRYYAASPKVSGLVFHSFGGDVDFMLAVKDPE